MAGRLARKSALVSYGASRIGTTIPMERRGKPEEIAYRSLYLCSDEAASVTGIEFVIDDGWLVQ